ncbi:MAG: SDR family oxidoreductase [Dermatophilaceae bacterium]
MTFHDYRTALVTGASTGIGAAVTAMLTTRGLTVYGVARDAERLEVLASQTGMIPVALDVTDTRALADRVGGLPIDVLVNNAGVTASGTILDTTAVDVDAMVDVNLRSVLHLCRLLVPGMVARDRGHVVTIGSISGLYPFPGHPAYHATKAAVHQLSRQLRVDVMGKRVRVSEICPGRVQTEILARTLGGGAEAFEQAREAYYTHVEPLTTADVAATVEFAVDAPRHVNISLVEVLPTFQVPGGIEFAERTD